MGKFRAWDKKLKKYHYFTGIFNKRPYTEHSTFAQYDSSPEYHELIIEEFTGRCDIKRTEEFPEGQEIYQGDKVIKDGKEYEIRYSDHSFDLATTESPFPKREDGYSYYGTSWDDIEVVGHIHEPEEAGVAGAERDDNH